MPMINLTDVSLSKLRRYRDFYLLKAFQPALADQSHQPFFSLDCHENWTTLSGYELYETWLKNSKDLSQDTGHAQALIDGATARDIKQFRDVITTPAYAKKDYFSTDNFHDWIRPVAFEAWMLWFREGVKEVGSRPSSRMSSYTSSSISRPPSCMSETADLSSDNERILPHYPPSSRATSSVYSITASSPDVIVISDSDDDEGEMCQNSLVVASHIVKREQKEREEIPQAIKREFLSFIEFPHVSSAGITTVKGKSSKGKARIPTDTWPKPSDPVKLTSKLTVNSISTITSLPSTWTVPRNNSATLVDLSALDSLPRKPNGDEYSIDALIRAEDQDSWGGSAGRSAGEVYVFGFDDNDPAESVHCRRAYLHCNGVDMCEHFDQEILEDCERYEPDPHEMRELWYCELDANSREALEEANIVSRFYAEVQKLKCKVPCTGKPVMRKMASGRSKYGKEYFIGCSAWKYNERDDHRYLPIPSNVDEDILAKVMDNDGVLPLNIALIHFARG
ncbi:uncharacterized protein LACBIDRAFT_332144 [Laccaria bicolor S238N-H82]|uniref:Predicted protein n=1 Tax=Laccaria bicolor (strain S238N-H82 / ATCC MYA-4686) TaxID=486041 RepID=B0DRR0_LACBS|nr:uncharacterized protein LACBIDRAFT_332144 [Laccaria bicolor S238N-H82]EDR02648.1 predicted protein [Laccaria bicolor S238N-H82]|eukprot:XP_001886692.1 predicted protein [Laccaria bicolor S238N-H82]